MVEVLIANKTEVLAEIFKSYYGRDRLAQDPLQPIEVISPNGRFTHWLNTTIAQAYGIAAQLTFARPQTYLDQYLAMHSRRSDESLAEKRYDKSNLSRWELFWSIFDYLSGPALQDNKLSIQAYLQRTDVRGVRRVKLTQKLANSYADLIWHDPDQLLDWEQGNYIDRRWEARLWEQLMNHRKQKFPDADHFVLRYARCLKPDFVPNTLSSPLYVFIDQRISPIFFKWLQIASKFRPITLFAMLPVFPEQAAQIRHDTISVKLLKPYELLWVQLMELSHCPKVFHLNTTVKGSTLLTETQNAFSTGNWSRSHDGFACSTVEREKCDETLQIHTSYSPTREVEALHHYLITRLTADASLQFKDILVVVPSLFDYAPIFRSIFGKSRGSGYIPTNLESCASRHTLQAQQAAFLFLIETGVEREIESDKLFERLLSVPAVLARVDLTVQDLNDLRHWWSLCDPKAGLEAAYRDTDAGDAMSTGFGGLQNRLKQLLMTYALDSEGDAVSTPLRHAIPSLASAPTLGKALDFLNQLCELRRIFQIPATGVEWVRRLRSLYGEWFMGGEATRLLKLALEEQLFPALLVSESSGNPALLLSCGALLCIVQSSFVQSEQSVLSAESGNQVQISEPEKSNLTPYRVIAILGLGVDAYAKTSPDDWGREEGERIEGISSVSGGSGVTWLAFLAASQSDFYLSYLQSSGDGENSYGFDSALEILGAASPPASSELPIGAVRQPVIRHAPKPYDPEELGSSQAPNLSVEWTTIGHPSDACGRLSSERAQVGAQHKLTHNPIMLEELFAFFRNPVTHWSRSALNAVQLPSRIGALTGSVAFNHRMRYLRRSEILAKVLTRPDAFGTLLERFRRYGLLTDDSYGEHIFAAEYERAKQLKQEKLRWGSAVPPQLVTVQTDGGDVLHCESERHDPNGIIALLVDRSTPARQLEIWLRHLVYAATGGQRSSWLLDWRGDCFAFNPLSEAQAKAYLSTYLSFYFSHDRAVDSPVRFFLDSSFAWGEQQAIVPGRSAHAAKVSYFETWLGTPGRKRGEWSKKSGFSRYLKMPEKQWSTFESALHPLLWPLFRHRVAVSLNRR